MVHIVSQTDRNMPLSFFVLDRESVSLMDDSKQNLLKCIICGFNI